MKKIKFVANYDNDINVYKSILNCFKLTDEQKSMLTYNDDYEYLGIFNGYHGQKKTTRDKIFGFLQEPIGNINYDRNLHFYCSKIFCQSYDIFKPNKGVIKGHLSMFFSNHTYYSYKNFLNDSFKKEKKLCMFVSGISEPNNKNWTNHNYKKRLNLVKKIVESDLDIDIYGRNLNLSDKRYKGSPDNKHEVLKNYEYSIAIENSCEENYISEKFFDCLLNNVIPLYYGCPNVDSVFNSKCYKALDINDNDVITNIKNICLQDSNNFQNDVLDAKNKYFETFNPITRILNEI